MIKKAMDLQPGDVVLYNGKTAIVEVVWPPLPHGVEVKLHTKLMPMVVRSTTRFLVSDKLFDDFVAAVRLVSE